MTSPRPPSRGEQTRQRALAAARTLLVTGGPQAFTMRAVAQAASMSLGNLQFHYATHRELMAALLHGELDTCAHRVELALASPSCEDPLATAVDVMLDAQLEADTARLFCVLWSLSIADCGLREELAAFYEAWARRVADALPRFLPEITPREALERARFFVAAMEGASLFRTGVVSTLRPAQERSFHTRLTGLLRGSQ